MLSFIRNIGQWIVLFGAVLSSVYAVRPDLRRWVETEVIARDVYYYLGTFELSSAGAEASYVTFFSKYWDAETGRVRRSTTRRHADVFDTLRAMRGETIVSLEDRDNPVIPGAAMVGWSEPNPNSNIETLVATGECFKLRTYYCRTVMVGPSGSAAFEVDENCEVAQERYRQDPDQSNRIFVWVKAARFTCREQS